MDNIKNLKEWRAEEISKVFLLKSTFKFSIDQYPTPLFDFVVSIKNKPKVTFAVEVKTTLRFEVRIKQQLSKIRMYRDAGMINIPVLLFKIDEKNETGEMDFLVIPSFKEKKLLVRNNFHFVPLDHSNLHDKVETILKWFQSI
jgi:hypothetical protein